MNHKEKHEVRQEYLTGKYNYIQLAEHMNIPLYRVQKYCKGMEINRKRSYVKNVRECLGEERVELYVKTYKPIEYPDD